MQSFHPVTGDGPDNDAGLSEVTGSTTIPLTHFIGPDGGVRWVSVVLTRAATTDAVGPAEAAPILVLAWDLTQQQRTQQHLRHQATHDALTGLPNRTLFLEHLGHALDRLSRSPEGCVAVLFLDLDRLKHVNDAYGHAAGDQLLATVADRLRIALRPQDVLARLGGDEFTVLLEDMCDRTDAVAIARRCLDVLATEQRLGGEPLRLTGSIGIGIAVAGADAADPADVLAQADAAMYQAKKAGRNRIEVFDRPHTPHMSPRAALERQLVGALDRGELEVYYQPIFDLTTGRINAGEALLRWKHATAGLLPAGDFIGIAEEAGLISGIGEWVCDTVTADLAAWDRAGTPGGAGVPQHRCPTAGRRDLRRIPQREFGPPPAGRRPAVLGDHRD